MSLIKSLPGFSAWVASGDVSDIDSPLKVMWIEYLILHDRALNEGIEEKGSEEKGDERSGGLFWIARKPGEGPHYFFGVRTRQLMAFSHTIAWRRASVISLLGTSNREFLSCRNVPNPPFFAFKSP